MKRAVVKIGGSILREPRDMERIIDIVRSYAPPPVVVVSAFAGVTDELLRNTRKHKRHEPGDNNTFTSIHKRAEAFLYRNGGNKAAIEQAGRQLARRFAAISLLLRRHTGGRGHTRRQGIILSYGERIASLVVATQLRQAGIPAREALPEELGLLTRNESGTRKIDFAASKLQVRRALDQPGVTVVPGFYGVSSIGTVHLLGRNGSDYSAAAIAACLNARSLDLFKDVEGIRSGDPTDIESTRLVTRLSYAEAADMAHFGSQVLHPSTIEPLIRQRIPIRLFGPHGGVADGPRTVVRPPDTSDTSTLKTVVSIPELDVIELESTDPCGDNESVLQVLDGPVSVLMKALTATQSCLQLFVAACDTPRVLALLSTNLPEKASFTVRKRRSLVALIGGYKDGSSLRFKQLSTTLRRGGLDAKILIIGSSRAALFVIVRQDDRLAVLRALHDKLIDSGTAEQNHGPAAQIILPFQLSSPANSECVGQRDGYSLPLAINQPGERWAER